MDLGPGGHLRITVIMRPREGAEMEELRAEIGRLRESGHRVRPRLTFEAGDGARLARSAARGGADLVIAAGGDGTINEVVNGLARSDWDGRLGIVALGTANDFAAGLGIPQEVGEAVRAAVDGTPTVVDVARVNRRYFVNVSTGGFGAAATEEAGSESKRLLGPWAYVITGAKKFAELRPARARFDGADGLIYEGEVMLFAVGNAKQTGGGSFLTPRAEFADGQLDVAIVPGMPRLDFVALLPDLRAGTHLDHPDVMYVQTPTVVVASEEPLSVNADGEPMSGRRFEYRLAERGLTVMTP